MDFRKMIRKLVLSLFGAGGAVFAVPDLLASIGMDPAQASDATQAVATVVAFLVVFGFDHIFGKRASESGGGTP